MSPGIYAPKSFNTLELGAKNALSSNLPSYTNVTTSVVIKMRMSAIVIKKINDLTVKVGQKVNFTI